MNRTCHACFIKRIKQKLLLTLKICNSLIIHTQYFASKIYELCLIFAGRLSQLQLCCRTVKWKGTWLGRHAVTGTSHSSCLSQCKQSMLHLGRSCAWPSSRHHPYLPHIKCPQHTQASRLCCQPGAVFFRLYECCQPDASCYDPSSFWPWSGIPSTLMSAVYCAQAFLHPWLYDWSPCHPWTRTACWCE